MSTKTTIVCDGDRCIASHTWEETARLPDGWVGLHLTTGDGQAAHLHLCPSCKLSLLGNRLLSRMRTLGPYEIG